MKSQGLFQYFERTIASTETNDTSTERFDSHVFGAGNPKGLALSGEFHAHLPQKDIEKKRNGAKSGRKKYFFLITPTLYNLSVCTMLFNCNKVYVSVCTYSSKCS